MTRSINNNSEPPSPTDSLSSPEPNPIPPSPLLSDEQVQRPNSKQLALFRADWNFKPIVDGLSPKLKAYFTDYFADDEMFTVQTLKAFKTWANLVPKHDRNKHMKELVNNLCIRKKGRKGEGWGIGSKKDGSKDKNLRLDLKALIKELDPTFEDSEAEVEKDEEEDKLEEEDIGKAAPAEEPAATHDHEKTSEGDSQRKQSTVNEGVQSGNGQKHGHPTEAGEYNIEKGMAFIRAISENWEGRLIDIVPGPAYPAKMKTDNTRWPLEILEALLELSKITKEQDDAVGEKLTQAFKSLKKYELEASLKNIKAVHDSFDEGAREAQTGAPVEGPATNADAAKPNANRSERKRKASGLRTANPSGKKNSTSTTKNTTHSTEALDEEGPTADASTSMAASQHGPTPQLTDKRSHDGDARADEPPQKRAKQATADVRNNAVMFVPSHLSNIEKKQYRLAVLASRAASTERDEAEEQLKVAKEARTSGYARAWLGDFGNLESAVADAEIEVQKKKRELIRKAEEIVQIVGVVGDEVYEEVWKEI